MDPGVTSARDGERIRSPGSHGGSCASANVSVAYNLGTGIGVSVLEVIKVGLVHAVESVC